MRKAISLIFLTIIVGSEAFAQESFVVQKGQAYTLPDISTGHVKIRMSAVDLYDVNDIGVYERIRNRLKEYEGPKTDLSNAYERMNTDQVRRLLVGKKIYTVTKNFTSPEELAAFVRQHAKMGDISVTVERSILPTAYSDNLLALVLEEKDKILKKGGSLANLAKKGGSLAKKGVPAVAAAVIVPFVVPEPLSASETPHESQRDLPAVPAAQ